MNNSVQFNNHNIELINHNGQLYMTGSQIGEVLEYEDAAKAVHNIYTNHKDEFGENMSCTLKTRVNGVKRLSRVFNREGAWLIGMFARTPKAAEFRKWVLKVLGAVADNQVAPVAAVDMKAIGGMVKRCVNKALVDFLSNELPVDDDDILRKKYYNVSDKDMAETLQRWYWSRNYDVRQVIDTQTQRIEELESKLRMIKQAIN